MVNTQAKLIRIAALSSVIVAITLVLLKAIVWWLSGSVSLLAGLTDSLLDSLASLLNLIAINIALKPADNDHRFGHGKAEALAGLAQAVFIAISAIIIGWQSCKRLAHPIPLEYMQWGIVVMVFSLLVTSILLLFQRYVIKRTGSTAITADSLHYKSDILLNISILLALALSHYGWLYGDAVFGLFISLYIFWTAVLVGKEGVEILMDRELSEEITQQMQAVAEKVPVVIGVHDLKTRRSGTHWFIQLHVELPATISLDEAHQHCLAVKKALQQKWPLADVTTHADPR